MHNNRTPTGPVSVSAPVSVNAPAPACGADCPTNYPSGNVDNRLIMSAAARLGGPMGLYMTVLVRCGGKGHCWPSVEKLATDLGAPVRTVVRWRDHLVKEGLVSIKRRRRPLTSMIYLTAGGSREATSGTSQREATSGVNETTKEGRGVPDSVPAWARTREKVVNREWRRAMKGPRSIPSDPVLYEPVLNELIQGPASTSPAARVSVANQAATHSERMTEATA